jgi:hypothetical protein
MPDEVRKELEYLKAEWEQRRRSIQDRLLAGAEIEGGGRVLMLGFAVEGNKERDKFLP